MLTKEKKYAVTKMMQVKQLKRKSLDGSKDVQKIVIICGCPEFCTSHLVFYPRLAQFRGLGKNTQCKK